MYTVEHNKYGTLHLKIGKNLCPHCRENGGDNSGDNLFFYGEGKGAHCFSCGWTIPSDEYKAEHNIDEEHEEEELTTREKITPEQNEALKQYTSPQGAGFRGIRDDINKRFGVRYQYDETTGDMVKQFVPTTVGYELAGYRVRKLPKDFSQSIGVVGKECDLIGQYFFKANTKTVVIVGGEVDFLSAYQMLADSTKEGNQKKNTDYEPPAVVCSTLGESGAYKQVQAQYEWFNQFAKIVVCLDADDAGQKATEKVVDVLPKGKVFVMKMRYKDPNEYLTNGKEKEFVQDFWNAKAYIPAGVKTAADAFEDIPDELGKPRIPLPDYMWKLQAMMGGGVRQGRIMNIIADTSIGKTTHVRRMVYKWIFDSPVVPTIVSLEDTAAQYMLDLVSVHLEENMMWNNTEVEVLEWLETEQGQRVKHELCFKPDGSPRFFIIDERGGTIKHIEAQMEVMFRKHGSTLFVIDVLTDLLRGSNADYAEDHMNFQKGFIKEGVTICNVHHTRKPQQDKEGKQRKATEYDTLGTGSFVQSGAYNIVLNRDKLAEDPLVRNTTEVDLPKCRGGKTGSAGSWYYDFGTVKCYDFDDWVKNNGPKDF